VAIRERIEPFLALAAKPFRTFEVEVEAEKMAA